MLRDEEIWMRYEGGGMSGKGVGVREDICGARGKGEGQGMREER